MRSSILRVLAASLLVLTVGAVGVPTTPAASAATTLTVDGVTVEGVSPGDAIEIIAELTTELKERPGGTVIGNTVLHPDGTLFVAQSAQVMAFSNCPNNRFCGWANSSYRGSYWSVAKLGMTGLNWSAQSYRNRRTAGSRLFNNAGTTSTCYSPGEGRATIGPAFTSPAKVNLLSGTC